MATIRVYYNTWDEATDRSNEGHTDHSDAFISIDGEDVLVIRQAGHTIAAYNHWNRAVTVDPKAEAKDEYSVASMADLVNDIPADKAPAGHVKWRSSSVPS